MLSEEGLLHYPRDTAGQPRCLQGCHVEHGAWVQREFCLLCLFLEQLSISQLSDRIRRQHRAEGHLLAWIHTKPKPMPCGLGAEEEEG